MWKSVCRWIVVFWCQFCLLVLAKESSKHYEESEHWIKLGRDEIQKTLDYTTIGGVAKNVILGVGDGMGVSTVTAAGIREGQLRGEWVGNFLHFERFPHVAMIKTYSLDAIVPDSASTGLSLMAGVKTNKQVVGLNSRAIFDNCTSGKGNEVSTILDWSLKAGKSVGIVTTDALVGATPSSAYAHVANRYWKNDNATPPGCRDIALQLVQDNPGINVILGGGYKHFKPRDPSDVEGKEGKRDDGRDLVDMWKKARSDEGVSHAYVSTPEELEAVDTANVDYLFGMFAPNNIPYINTTGYPTLRDMAVKAIEILSRNEKGFFLLVEGAMIDWAHHDDQAQPALEQTIEFTDAIKSADSMTDQSETLLVVTADHSHPFTISGYPMRGADIYGLTGEAAEKDKPSDGKRATILGYNNGPAWVGRERPDITPEQLKDRSFGYTGGQPRKYTYHSGEDVTVYAKGPMAHLIHGVQEQTYIAHVLAYASCTGNTHRKCDGGASNGVRFGLSFYVYVFMTLVCVL